MSIQTDRIKEEFAKRLHLAMDTKGYPLRGRARILSQEFKISDKGAGKWLNGEAIPETSKIPLLASFLGVNSEWLISGNGQMEPSLYKENSVEINKIESIELINLAKLNQNIEKLLRNGDLNNDQLKIINSAINNLNDIINSWKN